MQRKETLHVRNLTECLDPLVISARSAGAMTGSARAWWLGNWWLHRVRTQRAPLMRRATGSIAKDEAAAPAGQASRSCPTRADLGDLWAAPTPNLIPRHYWEEVARKTSTCQKKWIISGREGV